MDSKKSILITGGAGFIGSHLCKRLLNSNNRIICMDNLFSGDMDNIHELLDHPNFTFINHDVSVEYFLEDDIDEIYHMACPASPKAYQKDPLYTLRTCFSGTYNISELAYAKNARILLASTSEIYGDPLVHPQREEYFGNVNTIGIRSCYDEGKRIGETILTEFHRTKNVSIQIARIFNTFGPNMSPDDGRVVTNFIRQYLKNEDITIYGNGSQTRSLCYIDDTCDGLISLMSQEKYVGPVNIGNPHEQTIHEISKHVGSYIPESTSIIRYEPLPQDDPLCRQPDITKAKTILNWSPKIELDYGIQSTIEYIKTKI
jgi:UDP-glucuronate decarboxylase